MFDFFSKPADRIKIKDNNIFIDNSSDNIGKAAEMEEIFELLEPVPAINVYEDKRLIRTFAIETLTANSDLTGQYFHCSIRILGKSGVMIDGIVSKEKEPGEKLTAPGYEGIRFQPFYLSNAGQNNVKLAGKGLFERGLHFSGTITPANVRNICICDSCNKSFTIQHFHAGFAEVQYFYSSNSKETLIVPYHVFEGMPRQLQEHIDAINLKEIENKLPKSNDGFFKYFNSLRCPHCFAPFIDFEKHPNIRANEYYGNTYINQQPIYLKA